MPRLPNHSKISFISLAVKLAAVATSSVRRSGSGGLTPATVGNPLLNGLVLGPDGLVLRPGGLVLGPESRVSCSDACDEARSGARYRRTPGRCFRPRRPAGCSCPSGRRPLRRSGGVPAIDRRHGACIGSNQRGEREDAVAVIPAARRQGRDQGVASAAGTRLCIRTGNTSRLP